MPLRQVGVVPGNHGRVPVSGKDRDGHSVQAADQCLGDPGMTEGVQIEPRAMLVGQFVHLPPPLEHFPRVLGTYYWVLPLRSLQARNLRRDEAKLSKPPPTEFAADDLKAAFDRRHAPG